MNIYIYIYIYIFLNSPTSPAKLPNLTRQTPKPHRTKLPNLKIEPPNTTPLEITLLETTPLEITTLKITPLKTTPLDITPLKATHSKSPHSKPLPQKPPHSTPLNSKPPTGRNRSSRNRPTLSHLTRVAALLRVTPFLQLSSKPINCESNLLRAWICSGSR